MLSSFDANFQNDKRVLYFGELLHASLLLNVMVLE